MFEPVTPDALQAHLRQRFGFDAPLAGFRLWQHERGALWIAGALVEPEPADESVGVLVMRHPLPRGRLSTAFIRRFCAAATIRVAEVEGESLRAYLAGESQPWADAWGSGERIVRWEGRPLGRAHVREDTLESELPRPFRVERTAPLWADGPER